MIEPKFTVRRFRPIGRIENFDCFVVARYRRGVREEAGSFPANSDDQNDWNRARLDAWALADRLNKE
jgi:hypothetical protein